MDAGGGARPSIQCCQSSNKTAVMLETRIAVMLETRINGVNYSVSIAKISLLAKFLCCHLTAQSMCSSATIGCDGYISPFTHTPTAPQFKAACDRN